MGGVGSSPVKKLSDRVLHRTASSGMRVWPIMPIQVYGRATTADVAARPQHATQQGPSAGCQLTVHFHTALGHAMHHTVLRHAVLRHTVIN